VHLVGTSILEYLFIYLFIQQTVQFFHIFLLPFNNYTIFFLHFLLSFQSSSINPFSPISPLIPSAQVSFGLPSFLLPGGRHFITSSWNHPSSILWTYLYHIKIIHKIQLLPHRKQTVSITKNESFNAVHRNNRWSWWEWCYSQIM